MYIWSFKPTNIEIKPWLKPHIQMIYLKLWPWYQHLTGFNHNPLFLLTHQTKPILSSVTNYFILCIQEEYNAPEIGPWHTIVQCRVMNMRIGVRCTSHESWITTQTNLATSGSMKYTTPPLNKDGARSYPSLIHFPWRIISRDNTKSLSPQWERIAAGRIFIPPRRSK